MWGLIAAGITTGLGIWSANEQQNQEYKLQQRQAVASARNVAQVTGLLRDVLIAAGIAAGVWAVGAIVTAE